MSAEHWLAMSMASAALTFAMLGDASMRVIALALLGSALALALS